jgi:hypothetical protein
VDNATIRNLQVEKMTYWGRIQQSKLKNLSYQWKRYYFQNHHASSFTSTASHAKPCLLQNPSLVIQNSNRPSDFCNNMRFFGAPAQVLCVLIFLFVLTFLK